jgi:hypothetical protein
MARQRQQPPEFLSQFAVSWIDPESSTAMSDQRYVVAGRRGASIAIKSIGDSG